MQESSLFPHSEQHPSRAWSRRRLLGTAAASAPFFLPGYARAAESAAGMISFAAIGTGRMGRGNMQELMLRGLERGARLVAVCDLDSKRAAEAAKMVNDFYKERLKKDAWNCAVFGDYRELLAKPGIDAVIISTPDHWHAENAIAAAKAGKHIYLEKPLTHTIGEGQRLVKAVRENKIILQTGSMQRSSARFRTACELVRNGRLGKVHTITAHLPQDNGSGKPDPMPVPPNLNFNMWLGPTPVQPYTEHRVHPQNGYGRPGWLQIEAYCRGMITGWGAHMLDIAQWGHGSDDSGPVEMAGTAEFPKRGIFDVHTKITCAGRWADGVRFLVQTGPAGVTFEGERGKLFVSREGMQTEPRELAREKIGENEIHLYKSDSHMGNLLDCIKSGKDPICPVEVGHRSNSACVITHLAAKLGRKLTWDPAAERFTNDDEANGLLDYPHRDWTKA
jgi:myo-inositol 2-dehydrogenase / D-chiro-inositol 1-dehydrogenase